MFEIPEKHTNDKGESFYYLKLTEPGVSILHDLEWSKKDGLQTVITVQKLINELRMRVLNQLVENRSLFKNPPSLTSIQAITPQWGILVMRDNHLKWGQFNKWCYDAAHFSTINAVVRLNLKAIEISRSTIVPVWDLEIQQIIPDQIQAPTAAIDFDFGEAESSVGGDRDDVESIQSCDIMEESSEVFELHNPNARKRGIKQEVRRLMKIAQDAQLAADDAMSRFYDEFDLSEDESDFSDEDES